MNPNTGKIYGKDFPVKDCTLPGKKHKYQIASFPVLRDFAVDRRGVEEFTDVCPAGIEMEDIPTDGTYLAHIEARAFPDDIMTGKGSEGELITNVTLKFLKATGFYDIDNRFAEPFIYGGEETNGMNKIKDFSIGIPSLELPEQYQCKFMTFGPDFIDNSNMCRPDLRYGQCSRTKYSCPSNIVDCNDKEFFDPKNTGIAGIHKFPNSIITPNISYPCTQEDIS